MKQKLVILLFFIPVLLFSQINPNDYINKYKKAKEENQKYELLKTMKEAKNPLFNSFFLEIISSDEAFNLKREALLGLEENSDGPNMVVADKIAKQLNTEQNPLVTEAILQLLGKIGMAKHTSVILPFLKNEDEHVREAAVQALYNIGDKSCVPNVQELLQKESGNTPTSSNIRKYGMLILSKYEDKTSIPDLEKIFKEASTKKTNNDESLYALNAIKKADPEKAKEVIEKNTNSITNTEMKNLLKKTADIPQPKPASEFTTNKENSEESHKLSEKPQAETTIIETPVSSSNIPLTQEEVQELKTVYNSKTNALKQISILSNMAEKLKAKAEQQPLTDEEFSFLGDIYLKIGDIQKALKDEKIAKENFIKAKNAYKGILK